MPAEAPDDSVGLAIAARRDVFDPRSRLKLRRAFSWATVAAGYGSVLGAFMGVMMFQAAMPMLLIIPGFIMIAKGFSMVDRALMDLRKYDERVKPLPQAKLRMRLPPPA